MQYPEISNIFKKAFTPLALMLIVAGCAGKSNDAEVQTMSINVDFGEVHLCSRISPEITVAYAPKGTNFYDVRLVEFGNQERYLGGGTWVADESGLIPEGVLTRHYMGPCPPKDRRVEYAYVVSAMEENNPQPLAVRLYRFTPEL